MRLAPAALVFSLMTLPAFASSSNGGRCDGYILALSESRVTFSSGTDLADIRAARNRYRGDFLWVRRHGEQWLIADQDWVDRAVAFFAAQQTLGPQQAEVARQEAELDREEERMEDRRDDASRARLDEIHAKQAEVGAREAELDRREEELEREAVSKLWKLVDDAVRQGLAKRVRWIGFLPAFPPFGAEK
jgi:hypothetical protein